jgi:hypothetical protein
MYVFMYLCIYVFIYEDEINFMAMERLLWGYSWEEGKGEPNRGMRGPGLIRHPVLLWEGRVLQVYGRDTTILSIG